MILGTVKSAIYLFGLVLLFGPTATLASQEAESIRQYKVPSFNKWELRFGQGYGRLAEALATTGLVAVSMDDPNYNAIRKAALEGLCECISRSEADFTRLEGADSILLGDGQTIRTSLATATAGDHPLPLPSLLDGACGTETSQAMDDLRDQVALASSTFVQALDKLLHPEKNGQDLPTALTPLLRNAHGGAYHSISSIVQASSNLEHFHVYSKQRKSRPFSPRKQESALKLHTDAGLFLAFAPAYNCNIDEATDDTSFYLEDANGKTVQAVFPPSSVAIMLGAGSEHWLQTSSSSSSSSHVNLRATRHSVNMKEGDSRAWYGMMHLVPEAAIVEETQSRNWTFGDMREAMILKSTTKTRREFQDDSHNARLEDVSIGCGFSEQGSSSSSMVSSSSRRRRRQLQHVENAGACNNVTNFYCWMSCLDIPQADQAEGYINEGYSLYCVDPSVIAGTGKVSDAIEPCNQEGTTGLAMNTNCMGMWQPTAPGIPSQEVIVESSSLDDFEQAWCYGGTSMYMDGFHWVGSTCPIYLFPSLVISSPGALVLACFFTIIFGMILEWVIQRRRVTVSSYSPGTARLMVSASFYGVQLTMGYFIMLVVMIYSIPLFMSVVIGIVGGHVLFSSPDAIVKDSSGACCLRSKGRLPSEAEEEEEEEVVADNENEENDCVTTASSCCHNKIFEDEDDEARGFSSNNAEKNELHVLEGATPCCQNAL